MKLACIINGHWWKESGFYAVREGLIETTYQQRECLVCLKKNYRTVKIETIGSE